MKACYEYTNNANVPITNITNIRVFVIPYRMLNAIIYKELSYVINGLCFEAHNALGSYAKEQQYGDYIEQLLKKNTIVYERELILPPSFAGERNGRNRIDFLIENAVILEMKAKPRIEREDYNQMTRYLSSLNKKLGILVNFHEKNIRPRRVLHPQNNESEKNTLAKIPIKRIDVSLPLPEYGTEGSVGFDLYAREQRIIPSHSLDRIPSNLIIETPKGYALILAARSSLAQKKGLFLANGIGVIDQDYCGENDEILISVYNFTNSPVTVEKGERIAQGMFIRVDQMDFKENHTAAKKSRGGFGTTGS